MNILILSCSLNPQSRSRRLAELARDLLVAQDGPGEAPRDDASPQRDPKKSLKTGLHVAFVDLASTPLPFCDGAAAYGHEGVGPLAAKIEGASGIILASPIYNFDVNAAAKNVVELTGRKWTGKVVGFLCAAGGQGSYMSVMGLANSLMLDFRCVVVPRFVYATGGAFDETSVTDPTVRERVAELTTTVTRLAKAVEGVKLLSDSG